MAELAHARGKRAELLALRERVALYGAPENRREQLAWLDAKVAVVEKHIGAFEELLRRREERAAARRQELKRLELRLWELDREIDACCLALAANGCSRPRAREHRPRRNVRTTPAPRRGPPDDDGEVDPPDPARRWRGFLAASRAMYEHERRRAARAVA
jgi:hypothetical protein